MLSNKQTVTGEGNAPRELTEVLANLKTALLALGNAQEAVAELKYSDLWKDIGRAWDKVDMIVAALGEGGADPDYDVNGNWK